MGWGPRGVRWRRFLRGNWLDCWRRGYRCRPMRTYCGLGKFSGEDKKDGVETKVFNQAVKRNINRFPEDFMFQLTLEEWNSSQIVTSLDAEAEVIDNQISGNWSQIVTSSEEE